MTRKGKGQLLMSQPQMMSALPAGYSFLNATAVNAQVMRSHRAKQQRQLMDVQRAQRAGESRKLNAVLQQQI